MTINQHFIFKIFSIVLIVILASHPFAQANTLTTSSTKDDNFKLQPGDIILTKGPVLFGFFGHSSIALNHDTVLQIEGPGQKPITESFDSFKERFEKRKMTGLKYIDVLKLELVKKRLIGHLNITKIVIRFI